MSPSWIWSDIITNERVARVGYNHFISNKGEWNNCFSKFSNRVLPPIFISTILQSVRKENLAHYFPYDVKLRLLAHSRSFLANQKARNAIVGGENLLNFDVFISRIILSVLAGEYSVTIGPIARERNKPWKINWFLHYYATLLIGLKKKSTPLFHPIRSETKPIVPRLHAFSRASIASATFIEFDSWLVHWIVCVFCGLLQWQIAVNVVTGVMIRAG